MDQGADDLYRSDPGINVYGEFSSYIVNSISYSVRMVYRGPILLLVDTDI